MPERPSTMAAQASRQLLPSGQTVPMPVTTTRRLGSESGVATSHRTGLSSGHAARIKVRFGNGGAGRRRWRAGKDQLLPLRFIEDVDEARLAVHTLADVSKHVPGADLE